MVALPAATWDPAYEKEEGWTVHKYQLSTGNVIRFCARDIRKERTGVHANIAISMNWVTLAWSNFNVERDEDRVRLANSAFKHLDQKEHQLDIIEFPNNILKHALDLFCIGLWENEIGELVGGLLEGDPDAPTAQLLCGSYIIKGGGTILFAPPGMGKTYTAMSMAVSLHWGKKALWDIHEAANVLYVNVERSASSIASRLARTNVALGLEARTPLPVLNARGKSLSDVYEAAKKTIEKEECSVVFYDSISRAGVGSMVGDDVANRIMDMLNGLSPTWIALAHSPRGDDGHAYGSQMFDAAADLTVQLRSQVSRDGRSTGVALQLMKANDLPKKGMSVHVMEWDDFGLAGFRRAQRGEFADLEAGEKRSKEEEAEEYLANVGEATASQVAEHFGWARNHTSAMLSAANWAVSIKRGREVYFRAASQRTY